MSADMPQRADVAVRRPWTVGALIGLLTAVLAVAVSQLVAAFVDEAAAPVVAVGAVALDLSPAAVKEFAIGNLGESAKVVLLAGIAVLLAMIAGGIGVVALRRAWIAYAALFAFAAIGVLAAVTRPAADELAVLPSAAGAACGAVALGLLLGTLSSRRARSGSEVDGAALVFTDRRRFLLTGVALGGVAIAAGAAGRLAGAATRRTVASRETLRIPPPADPAPPPVGESDVEGLSAFHTPNASFFRVDTAIVVPKIEARDWRLRIHGMVDREVVMDLSELLARPLMERDITITCVSNEVGGPYIGNARWIGAPLAPILDEAGVQAGADQLVSRSVDGFTLGTPTEVVMDGRDAMLAVAMNGEPLPLEHGFPVRMIVPGLYGYVSATKWVVDLELTTFDAYDAYWVRRGWAERAPIKTMSRIDTPRSSQRLQPGEVAIAGVAWAQRTGIERVEVRVDDGAWAQARLPEVGTIDTWRQWVHTWEASPGTHTIQVRATDRSGYTQTAEEVPPLPDGATGWHSIEVSVT